MRCPKCSFVSFDLVESCVKCGKNISAAATELQGTVAGVELPTFLKMPGAEVAPEVPDETGGFDAGEEPLDLGAEGEEETMDFTFDEEPSSEAGAEAVEMDFDEVGDAEAGVEIDFGAEETGADEVPEINLGFDEEVSEEVRADEEAAIGISDLAPDEEGEEEFALAGEEEAASGAGQGLEDLKVDGIDLESTPGVPESGKVMPSVKTGTALDDFDIDLGDLLTGKKD